MAGTVADRRDDTPTAEADRPRRGRPRHPIALAGVLVLSIAASVAYLLLSPHGAHATNDSFTYLGAARNLAHGQGWTYPFGDVGAPVTLFPPVFPLILALPERLGIDGFRWVTWQNAILLGVLALVVGLAVVRATDGSAGAAATAIALAVLGTPTLVAFAYIWSEPLFYPIEIAALATLGLHLSSGRRRYLVMAAACTGLAMLTRYAGSSLFIAGCLLVALWPRGSLLDRARRLGVFVAISLPFSIAWAIRNLATSGTLTGNNELIHRLTASDLREGVQTITAWFAPTAPEGSSTLRAGILVLGAIALVLSIWWIVRRGETRESTSAVLAAVCAGFAFVHLLFVAAANAFSTRAPPFNDRILGPMFVPIVIALVLAGQIVWRAFPRPVILRIAVAAVAILLVAASGAGAWDEAPSRLGSASKTRSDFDELARALRPSISPGATLLSNRPNIAWWALQRPVTGLPKSCRGGRVLPNPTYDRELRSLADRLRDAPRQVIVFRRSRDCSPFSVDGLETALRVERTDRVRGVLILSGPVRGT